MAPTNEPSEVQGFSDEATLATAVWDRLLAKFVAVWRGRLFLALPRVLERRSPTCLSDQDAGGRCRPCLPSWG